MAIPNLRKIYGSSRSVAEEVYLSNVAFFRFLTFVGVNVAFRMLSNYYWIDGDNLPQIKQIGN
ncbi:hypothetical protein MIR68_000091 [Amoeboaphelidium protococcarum]|nr:hypothetical protein MIR68_000091 [Amoeboaphelidium protococcarum]